MNPKKRILKILSVFLSLIFLSSLACAAYAEYEEYDKDDPSQWVEHNGELIPKEVYERDFAPSQPAGGPEQNPDEVIDQTPSTHPSSNVEIDYTPSSSASKLDFMRDFTDNAFLVPDYSIPVEPKLPPMWGEGLTNYVDNAISAVEETAAGGTMTIRADESGMTTVSRTVLQAFEDRGDFDLECYYDRFGTVMKLVIPAGTKVIEHIGNASFVEFHTLADRLGITPVPEEEADAEPDNGSMHVVDTALWLRDSRDAETANWYNVNISDIVHLPDGAIVSIPWYKPEDGLTIGDLLTADGSVQPLTVNENGEAEIPVESGKAEAVLDQNFAVEGKTPEETKEDITSLLSLLQKGMDEKKAEYLQPDQDIGIVLVFEEEQERVAFEEEAKAQSEPDAIPEAENPPEAAEPAAAKTILLYDQKTADLQELLSLDRHFYADEEKITLSENAAEILKNDQAIADAVMEAILAIDRHRSQAEDTYSFDLGDGESVTFTKDGIAHLLSKARERIIYRSDEEQQPDGDKDLNEFLNTFLEEEMNYINSMQNNGYYETIEPAYTITLVFSNATSKTAFEPARPEGPKSQDFTWYN